MPICRSWTDSGSRSKSRIIPRFGEPKIVMLTSVGLRGDAAKCREAGIGAYLTKP